MVHALILALRGRARLELSVAPAPFQALFVASVITAGPILAAGLLWPYCRALGA